MLRHLLSRSVRKRRATSSQNCSDVEALESRALLAGDIAATIRGGDLLLTGDRAANQVEVSVLDGDVVVQGLDGTTINGQAEFTAFAGRDSIPDDLIAKLGEGSDQIVIGGGLSVEGTIEADLGSGANMFAMSDASADRLMIRAEGANTVLLQAGTEIDGDLGIRFKGNGADTIVIEETNVGDDVSIRAGHGVNSIVVDGATVADDVAIAGGRSEDSLLITGSDIDDDISVKTRSGSDFVMIEDTDVREGTRLSLGSADDNVILAGANNFGRGVTTGGSSGADAVEVSDETDLNGRDRTSRVERTAVDADLLTELLDGTPDGLNTRRASAQSGLDDLIFDGTLTLDVDPASFAESGSAATATITTNKNLSRDLVVTLSAGDSDAIDVPDSVTIPAGQTSVTFDVTPVDNTNASGTQSATITATADRHVETSAAVNITDDDVLSLSISTTSFSEAAGAQASTGTVTRESATTDDLVVNLSSSDETAATVPATVTIPAGATSVTFDIAAVDDAADGDDTQTSTITVTATGHSEATATVSVTNDDELTMTVDDDRFFEGTTDVITGTVSRSGDTTDDLVVTLSSSDVTGVTVPESVTIAAGQLSADFTITPVDDDGVDDEQNVTITATASGHSEQATVVAVRDDDFVEVFFDDSSISEVDGAEATRGKVRRESATDEDLIVTLINGDSSEIDIPTTVTIPAGSRRAFFDVTAVNDNLPDGTVTVTVTAQAPNHREGSKTLDVLDDNGLTLSAPTTSVNEATGAEAAVGTVTREGDLTEPLIVTLTSSDTTELTILSSVTILAGEASTSFPIDTVDDTDPDLTQTVTITASAADFADTTLDIDVLDDDAAIVAQLDNDVVSETVGSVTITLERNSDSTEALTVDLTASPDGNVTLPATAEFAAGENSIDVVVTVNDDTDVQGNRDISIIASTSEHQDGAVTLTINDDEAQLDLTLADELVAEGFGPGGTTGTVTRNTPTDEDLVVNLVSSNLVEITVPATVTIPAGQTSATFDLNVLDDDDVDLDQIATISASAVGHASDSEAITVNDNDTNAVRIDSSERSVASSDLLITKDENYLIEGLTAPNATLGIDTDGDEVFDDGTVTADAAGRFTFTAPLQAGENSVEFQADDGNGNESEGGLILHLAEGSVVRFNSVAGFYDVELLDEDAPITVANFLNYLGRYTDSIIHRSPEDFVIQGGGFVVQNGLPVPVNTDDPIQNEFNSANSNLRGTLSMAQLGGQPNSGTSQWFVNVVDNTFLDDVQHTVFGRVIGAGMGVVDAINNLDIFDITGVTNQSALGETPLFSYDEFPDLTGTVSGEQGSAVISGTGTSFTSELQVGDVVRINGTVTATVLSIESDTEMTVNTVLNGSLTDVTIERRSPPEVNDYVLFNSISELLDDI